MPVTGSYFSDLRITETLAQDLRTSSDPLLGNGKFSWAILNGVGPDKANAMYIERFNLASGVSVVRDLKALVDGFGNVLDFLIVKGIYIKADATNIALVEYGDSGANGFKGWTKLAADVLICNPDGKIDWFDKKAGVATAAGNKDIKLTHDASDGAAIDFDLLVVGEK